MPTAKNASLEQKVLAYIREKKIISPGEKLVVAVSGGPDSVCLLDILSQLQPELGIELVVAHFDHGLRPAEDEMETRFVRDLASRMDLPFEVEKGLLREGGGAASWEEKARDARYAFLQAVREKHRAQKIAVGHNLDDQAETVLMRLLRGSGPTGLAGIPPETGAGAGPGEPSPSTISSRLRLRSTSGAVRRARQCAHVLATLAETCPGGPWATG